MGGDNDVNVQAMITRLMWTIWTSLSAVRERPLNLITHSLTHGGNGLKFCTLMYLDHLHNWLVYGHGLLIFVSLALFLLSETGRIWGFRAFPRRTHGGNDLKCCMLMYLDHLQNCLVYCHSLLIFLILALFWLSETGQIWGFWAFPGEPMEEMTWNVACWCILTTCRTD